MKPASPLTTELLLRAYCMGFFPMADGTTGELSWYSPDPRAILPLGGLLVSRSLRSCIRKKLYEVRVDTSFETVIRSCADRNETWISEKIIEAYVELHRQGFAHSVETWQKGQIVGGLYGVAIGGAFFGESMFSRTINASKVALVFLVELLCKGDFLLLDTQYITAHLRSLGAVEIPRSTYLELLNQALNQRVSFPASVRD